MSDTVIEQKPANPKADEWAQRIAAQRRSGMSVKQFFKEQGLTEYSFYAWRKRLQESGPVRFALVERNVRRQERTAEPARELVLATGAAHWRWRGHRDLADRAGPLAGMIHLPASVRVYLCLTPCDMRKSFDSLQALVREHLELDAFAGHLFVFTSRRKDREEFVLGSRRFRCLEQATGGGDVLSSLGNGRAERRREITAQELSALLSGIDLSTAKRRTRYRRAEM
jgi:transposase